MAEASARPQGKGWSPRGPLPGASPTSQGWQEVVGPKGRPVLERAWDMTGGALCRAARDVVSDGFHFIAEIRREFGVPMQVVIFSNYFFVKGIAYVVSNAVGLPLFKEHLGVGAADHQRAEAFYRLPWALKGIAGILADGFAVCGYSKRTTMTISAMIGTAGAFFLTLVSPAQMTPLSASLALFAVNLQASFNDLWIEGHYTSAMREKPRTGASLTSFVWLCTTVGMATASGWVGPALDYVSFNMICLPVIVCCFQQLIAILYPWPFRGWKADGGIMGETWTSRRIFKDRLKKDKSIFICGAGLTVIACGAVGLQLIEDPQQIWGFAYALTAASLLLAGLGACLPRYLFKPLAFLFLSWFCVPSIGSVLTYWLTAGPECVPGGPNLSWTFQITIVSLVGSFFSIIGVVVFQRYVSRWTFRRAFWITSVIALVTSVFDIAMIMRWNINVFHIPDKVWYFLSDGIIEEVVAMFAFMPSNVLLSRLCPAGLESTVYAILGGVTNFGRTLSKYTGNFLTVNLLGITTTPEAPGGCNFDNLWVAIVICSAVMPLLPIALTFWLIPNVKMNVHIATSGTSAQAGVVQNDSDTVDTASDGNDAQSDKGGRNGKPLTTLVDGPDSAPTNAPSVQGTAEVAIGVGAAHAHIETDGVGAAGVHTHTAPSTPAALQVDGGRARDTEIILAEVPHPFLGSIPIEIPFRFHCGDEGHPLEGRGDESDEGEKVGWWPSRLQRPRRPVTSMDMRDGIMHHFKHCPQEAAQFKELLQDKQARLHRSLRRFREPDPTPTGPQEGASVEGARVEGARVGSPQFPQADSRQAAHTGDERPGFQRLSSPVDETGPPPNPTIPQAPKPLSRSRGPTVAAWDDNIIDYNVEYNIK